MATNRDIRNIFFWSPRWLTLWVTLLPVLQHRNIFLWSHIWVHLSLLRVFVEAECLRWCCCCLCPSKGSPRALARTTQSEPRWWETRVSHKTGRPGHLRVLASTIVDDSLEVTSLRCIPLWLIRVKRVVKTWQSSCTQLYVWQNSYLRCATR